MTTSPGRPRQRCPAITGRRMLCRAASTFQSGHGTDFRSDTPLSPGWNLHLDATARVAQFLSRESLYSCGKLGFGFVFFSYTLKSLNKSDSFLSKGLWPTGGLVQPSAGKTAVDAELAANVRDAVPPHIDVVVLE